MEKQRKVTKGNGLVHKFALVIFVLTFCCSASVALATEKKANTVKPCYRMIEQERYSDGSSTPDNKHPVCKVVLDNLNKLCDDETPMVRGFKIHPKEENNHGKS